MCVRMAQAAGGDAPWRSLRRVGAAGAAGSGGVIGLSCTRRNRMAKRDVVTQVMHEMYSMHALSRILIRSQSFHVCTGNRVFPQGRGARDSLTQALPLLYAVEYRHMQYSVLCSDRVVLYYRKVSL
jgi:hypothetical protein